VQLEDINLGFYNILHSQDEPATKVAMPKSPINVDVVAFCTEMVVYTDSGLG